jgi:hypothetical protein
MLESWKAVPEFQCVQEDTLTLSFNVLAPAGLRTSHDFQSSSAAAMDGSKSYRDALQIVLDNAIALMLSPPGCLGRPSCPKAGSEWAKRRPTFDRIW